MNFLWNRYSPIGISLGQATIHAFQYVRAGGENVVHRSLAFHPPGPGATLGHAQVQQLAAALRRQGFVGRRCVVSLPQSALLRGCVDVAPAGALSLEPVDAIQQAAGDFERVQQLEPGSYELAAWLPETRSERRGRIVALAGCRHAAADPLLDAFAAAGLVTLALDTRANAIACGLQGLQPSAATDESTLVLDIDHATSELAVVNRGTVMYQRALTDVSLAVLRRGLTAAGASPDVMDYLLTRCGFAEISESFTSARWSLAFEQFERQLLQEIRPALDYLGRLFPQQLPTRLLVVGDASSVAGLEDMLTAQLKLPAWSSDVAGPLHEDRGFLLAAGLTQHDEGGTWAAA